MTDFASQLQAWQLFFSTVSLAAATLAGLLFVSLSLRHDEGNHTAIAQHLQLARGSFGDFLYVLMLGLVFLVPHQVPLGLAVALFVLGGARATSVAREAAATRRDRTASRRGASVLREVALPAVASVGLMLVGIAVLLQQMVAIYALVLVVAALLATASWNAWLILVDDTRNTSYRSPV